MDAKITKTRLSRMLSYDWLKIIGTAAAFIFVWVLVFTITATRILPSQRFTVCNYIGNITVDGLTKSVSDAYTDGAFSHEVIEVDSVDMTTAGDSAYQLLEARTSTNELDAMFVSMQNNPNASYKKQGEKETKYLSYFQTFAYNYRYMLHDIREYITELKEYLNAYHNGDYLNNPLDEKKVERDFRSRADGDKRYKKEKEIQKALQGERERFAKYKTALKTFEDCLEKGYIEITDLYKFDEETGDFSTESLGGYGLNLAPSSAPDKWKTALSRITGYNKTNEDGKGSTVIADNMQLCLFDSNESYHYRHEGILYVSYLLDQLGQSLEA